MAKSDKIGHRQKLRSRFQVGDAASRSDEMLLELLLSYAIVRKDVRSLAHELIQVFGSLSQVLSASPNELLKIEGVGEASIALLKAVNFIRLRDVHGETRNPKLKKGDSVQKKLFKNLPENQLQPDSEVNRQHKLEKPAISPGQPEKKREISSITKSTDLVQPSPHSSQPSKKASSDDKRIRRKFQVSNGYLLEFNQLARILHFLLEHRNVKKINRKDLEEDTGLAERQVETLVSMGAAMGLIKSGRQVLTPAGLLIAKHDIFIEKRSTLEWCHYTGAGSYRNLIWFEIFNRLLMEATPMIQEEWNEQLRSYLVGKYSKRTIGKSLYEEVRFVVDAYTKRNFSKLELLNLSSDEWLYRRRYTHFTPLVFCAMIYDFCAGRGVRLFQVGELAVMPGSPAVVFGLDIASFRLQIEGLHDRGWLRYETTHNLDQIRLKPGFTALAFLTAHFEEREPVRNDE